MFDQRPLVKVALIGSRTEPSPFQGLRSNGGWWHDCWVYPWKQPWATGGYITGLTTTPGRAGGEPFSVTIAVGAVGVETLPKGDSS